MTGSNKLTKRDYLKTSLRAFFLQNGFNYSNYQGLGYANVMYPALKKHYGADQEGFYQALEENCWGFSLSILFSSIVLNHRSFVCSRRLGCRSNLVLPCDEYDFDSY